VQNIDHCILDGSHGVLKKIVTHSTCNGPVRKLANELAIRRGLPTRLAIRVASRVTVGAVMTGVAT
jgi:hypothetical protein